jgi:hypothetical protein
MGLARVTAPPARTTRLVGTFTFVAKTTLVIEASIEYAEKLTLSTRRKDPTRSVVHLDQQCCDDRLHEIGYEVPLLKALNKQPIDFLILLTPEARVPATVLK